MKRLRINESEDEEEEEEVQRGRIISNLPRDVFFNIISRLPLETIFNCRCVCKVWLDRLLNPNFALTHLMGSLTSLFLQPQNRVFMVDTEEGEEGCCKIRHREFHFDFNPMSQGFVVSNSCHGFLCLLDTQSYEPIYVCNPVTGEYTMLPRADQSDSSNCYAYAYTYAYARLGFSPRTNEFKVVQFIVRSMAYPFTWETKIHTIGANSSSWRSVDGTPGLNGKLPPDAFLKGFLHWVVDDCRKTEFIQTFDFRTEQFGSCPPPPCFGQVHKKRVDLMSMGVLNCGLCLCDYPFTDHFDVWVMKEYGVQRSWTKEFVIETPIAHTIWPRDSYQLISLLSNGEILMLHNSKALVSYNLGKKSIQFLRRYSIQSSLEAILHTPSFVSLKDSAMGKNLKVLNLKSRWRILESGKMVKSDNNFINRANMHNYEGRSSSHEGINIMHNLLVAFRRGSF